MFLRNERFSMTGIALNPDAKQKSKAAIMHAVIEWQRNVPQRSPLSIYRIAGSYAMLDKQPRLGLYPRDIAFEIAIKIEHSKRQNGIRYPSDVDICLNLPGIPDYTDQIKQLSKHIYENMRVLLQPLNFDPRWREFTITLDSFYKILKRN